MTNRKPPANHPGEPALELIPLDLQDPVGAVSEESGLEHLEVELSIEEALGDAPPARPPSAAAPPAAESAAAPSVSRAAGPERPRPAPKRPVAWCTTCGAQHPLRRCRGEVVCREPERHGWRVTVETPIGRSTHGVLLAPTGDLWRARIMTYPRTLWTVPGGLRTLKFLGETPHEAERQAREFIHQHVEVRGHAVVDDDPAVTVQRAPDDDSAPSPDERSQRKLGSIHVRYGVGKADQHAVTADLSQHGVFIVTGRPHETGTLLRIHVELKGIGVPLEGVVRWCRERATPGRPQGMGVQLSKTPAIYRDYVRNLA